MQIRNNVTLIGNVGQQPELRKTNNGLPILNFSLATNDYWKDKDGNRNTRTEWHNIVVFGAQAESLGDMLKKGSKLAVSGSIRYNKWTDKNDQVRIKTNIHLDSYVLLTPKEVAAEA